jgi:hypothetical protein
LRTSGGKYSENRRAKQGKKKVRFLAEKRTTRGQHRLNEKAKNQKTLRIVCKSKTEGGWTDSLSKLKYGEGEGKEKEKRGE